MNIFKDLDKNNDGILTKQELEEGLRNNEYPFNKNDIEAIFNNLDDNQSGAIDYTEFITAALNRQLIINDEKIAACFELFDRDKSGKISIKEFQNKFQKSGGVDEKSWEQMLNEADKNGDGEIDFEEFRDLLKNLI